MKLFLFLAAIVLSAHNISAQGKFPVANIPENLRKDAHSVVREEQTDLDIKSIDKASYNVHRVITILDENAKDELFFYMPTDRFRSLADASIEVFDVNGKSIRKFYKSDLSKRSNPYDLVPDGMVYYLNIPVASLPVTIATDLEIKMNGVYRYPDCMFQQEDQSVEHTAFTIKIPADIDFRYRPMNVDLVPVISESDRHTKSYTWSMNNLPVKKYEEGSGSILNSFPWIQVSPNRFELDGYEGNMGSWQDMGLWYNKLVKTDNTLSPAYKLEIQQLTAGVESDKEKARIIYNYLQNNFRYVSIQLGIGGFKPFAADFVHKKKYGDCKALSNYMQACLNAVNIKSYSAWIKGDLLPNHIDPGFPKDDFNHQILCIPFPNDTTWLECTSSTSDFGVLGSFTENRYGLLLTESGGVLVSTPKTTPHENNYASVTRIFLNEDGSGKAVTRVSSTGEYKRSFIAAAEEKKDEQKKFLVKGLEFLQPDEFEFKFTKGATGVADINLDIEKIPDFTAGNKFFLNPRIYKMWSTALPKGTDRVSDYYLPFPGIITDTTIYQLPEGFTLETLPQSRKLKFDYGTFNSSYVFDAASKTVISTAKLEIEEGRIPAAGFMNARKFFNEVLSEYNEKIVVKKL